jgi:hypothetical protein
MSGVSLQDGFESGTAASSMELPTPTLTLDFRISVQLHPKISVGHGPWGHQRNWISFSGGQWHATWGSGTVVVCHDDKMSYSHSPDSRRSLAAKTPKSFTPSHYTLGLRRTTCSRRRTSLQPTSLFKRLDGGQALAKC